ncbi:hypothetical protein J6590_012098 [Homalodisca vitripennis]|nr:hypothetical protein J6590_012098 [Homalodisca vitripennis]
MDRGTARRDGHCCETKYTGRYAVIPFCPHDLRWTEVQPDVMATAVRQNIQVDMQLYYFVRMIYDGPSHTVLSSEDLRQTKIQTALKVTPPMLQSIWRYDAVIQLSIMQIYDRQKYKQS